MRNYITHISVYCIDNYSHSKCGTYAGFVRINSAELIYRKVSRATANRLHRVLQQQVIMPRLVITDRFVGVTYPIIKL